ncbi:MAG: hypothetical protein EOP09_13720 [Proteobacteria bacterium]|nr:MAG: hypothetical protein EOP09_13720 [Pseudomonadota bacterium]
MKFLILTLLLVSSVGSAAPAPAAPKKPETSAATAGAAASATAHNFEDLLVQGKYHFSDEAVTTVEEDKVLDSLIGVRSDFKDRLKSSTGSY